MRSRLERVRRWWNQRAWRLAVGCAAGLLASACGGGPSGPSPTGAGPVPGCPPLPRPALAVDGVSVANGYHLTVTNAAAFSDELFAPSPDLPACGLNANASRTWVDIHDARGPRLYGYCAIAAASELTSTMWLPLVHARPSSTSIYIVMADRKCQVSVTSNVAALPAMPRTDTFPFTLRAGSTSAVVVGPVQAGDGPLDVRLDFSGDFTIVACVGTSSACNVMGGRPTTRTFIIPTDFPAGAIQAQVYFNRNFAQPPGDASGTLSFSYKPL